CRSGSFSRHVSKKVIPATITLSYRKPFWSATMSEHGDYPSRTGIFWRKRPPGLIGIMSHGRRRCADKKREAFIAALESAGLPTAVPVATRLGVTAAW